MTWRRGQLVCPRLCASCVRSCRVGTFRFVDLSLPAEGVSSLHLWAARRVVSALGRASYVVASRVEEGWTASSENARLRRARARGTKVLEDLSRDVGPVAATAFLVRSLWLLTLQFYAARVLIVAGLLGASAALLLGGWSAALVVLPLAPLGLFWSRRVVLRLAGWDFPPGVPSWLLDRFGGSFPAGALCSDDVLAWLSGRAAPAVVETMLVFAEDYQGDLSELLTMSSDLLGV